MTKIQMRRDTANFWQNQNTVLAEGELGLELDSSRFKVGNGVSGWNDLDYVFVDIEANTLRKGDNVSELVNDVGYLTEAIQSGDNVSELVNDANYAVKGDDVSEFINDAGYVNEFGVYTILSDGGYLTEAIQSGDNVSELVNDAGYLTETEVDQIVADDALQSGDNVSELVNDAGYLTTALQSGDNVSELANDAGYLINTDVDQILVDGGFLTDALQSGDNVSELVNDANYLTVALQSGDNVSELVNDANYLTVALQSGDNVSELVNDANYLDTSSSINDLTDVTIPNTPPTGHYLKWDGNSWVSGPGEGGGGTVTGIELTDLSAATFAPGVTSLTYNNVSGVYTYTPPDLSGYLTSFTETDPVFTASPASGIQTTDITNWGTAFSWGNHSEAGYLESSSAAGGISAADITLWNEAYGWGDHSTFGYLTSYTESDPLFSISAAAGIQISDIGNWNSAYGWGNHANAGYASGSSVNNASNWDEAYGWGDHANANYASSDDILNATSWDEAFSWGNHANAGYASGSSVSNASNWDEAFSWGNHANAGYASGSSVNNATNWDTAFSWGDHADVGYLTSESDTLSSVVSRGSSTTSGITVGSLTAGGLSYPTSDGSVGQQLVTNGSGSLTFANAAVTRIHCDIRNYYTNSWATAFQNCADANGVVYFPKGTYNFNGVVSRTSSSIRVYGDGSGESIINFTNGGFNFTGSQTVGNYHTIIVENIGITGTGTNALRIEYFNNGGVSQKAYCNDVAVTGTWTTGFRLCNTDLSTFENCSVYRPVGYEGVGVEITVDDASQGGTDPVNIRFNNWQIAGLDTAFKVNSQAEGVYFHDNLIIACRVGFELDGNVDDNEAAEPYYIVRGNNIDVWKNCIRIEGLMQCVITDNSFYKFQSGPQNENWKGIILDGNSYDNIITDNIFNGNITDPSTDSSLYWGVHIKRSVGSSFSNNTFLSLDLGFKLDETSQNSFNKFVDNTYRVVTQHFNTFSSGNSLAVEMITRGHYLSERAENNRYNMINGDGFYVYDVNNISGFRLGPDTREALQTLKTEAAAATDFDSLKAAIATALADI